MTKQLIIIGLGGGLGSIFRYLTSLLTAKFYTNAFPLATFATNILGCFLIGVFVGLFANQLHGNNHLKLFLVTGFCGGYTTFSTFASENISLFQSNQYLLASFYISLSVFAGIFAVGLGIQIVK